MTSFYSAEELETLGFLSIGSNAMISRKCSIYGIENIEIGNDVRVDDFCILSGKIKIGNNVHVAVHSSLFGGKTGIEMHDFSCVSSRIAVYAESDDYSGMYMTNPTLPGKYTNMYKGKVILSKHVLVGSGSTILPGVVIAEGCSVGAMSLVKKSTEPWGIYAGIPCKRIKERSKNLLELEEEYLKNNV